jgi:hypothetical protein
MLFALRRVAIREIATFNGPGAKPICAKYLWPKIYAEHTTNHYRAPGCSHDSGRPHEAPNAGNSKLHARSRTTSPVGARLTDTIFVLRSMRARLPYWLLRRRPLANIVSVPPERTGTLFLVV